MASSCKCNGSGNGGGEEDPKLLEADPSKPLKSGERILAPTRRPDGTLRKAVRIRAGYVPQDEVAIYQSRGALVSSISSFSQFEIVLYAELDTNFCSFTIILMVSATVEKGDGFDAGSSSGI